MTSDIRAAAIDPDGHEVVLDEGAWRHIISEHPEMQVYQAEIMHAVSAPTHRRADPRPGRTRYYRQGEGIGPSRWMLVVVDFNAAPARIVTAFGMRRVQS